MVASGVASKGLDFNEIQHVIVYSMPKEIEDYVHEIGRTGRSGKTGIATTFINHNTSEQTLLDIEDPRAAQGASYKGCPICGGLGHALSDCPKLEEATRRQQAANAKYSEGGY
jgi:ATP-dependent RNA helicase DDX41